ncbi:licodione synthase-like [Senna tora]|uniref:Licodione synthase-like n=1 Tax=Senna tora TaxID=362788 RepID=A0A834TJY7_9FABA|nr:licodione synthase-like [Senna tora]
MEFHTLLLTLFLSSLLLLFLFGPRRGRLPPAPRPCLPIIGHLHLLGRLVHHSLHRLSLRYGPLFSLHFGSVPCIVVSIPRYAKLVLQDNELSFSSRPESKATRRLTYDASLAFTPYGPYWKFIKRISFNELFGPRGTDNFKALRAREYRGLLRLMAHKARAHEPVNVTEALLKLTNNVISRMIMGEAEESRDVVREVTKIFGEFNVADFVPIMNVVDFQGYGKRVEDLFGRFDSLADRIITKREEERRNGKRNNLKENINGGDESDGVVKDFLDIMLDFGENENSEIKINRTHIKALIMDFFTAGTDTTATTVEWALVELMNHPNLLQKARQEINDVVGTQRLVDESDGPNLPFIQAIIKEIFRLHPPVPLVSRRCVKECAIDNYVIPENSLVIINAWAMGRNPKFWDSPLDFRPERFLGPKEGGKGPLDVRGQHFELLPFGSGRRMCSGVTLAMSEVPEILAALIQCFDFQVVGPEGKVLKGEDGVSIDMEESFGLTVTRAHNLVCVPIERPICGTLNLGSI